MKRKLIFLTFWIAMSMACQLTSTQIPPTPSYTPVATGTASPLVTDTVPPPTPTTVPTIPVTQTNTPLPVVESLKVTVKADLLSCRYGPGAEYLYLYALRATANIKLIGRTDANNWLWVDGKNKCWVNAKFLEIQGDPLSLPIVYPGIAKLPVSPYYPGPSWSNAK